MQVVPRFQMAACDGGRDRNGRSEHRRDRYTRGVRCDVSRPRCAFRRHRLEQGRHRHNRRLCELAGRLQLSHLRATARDDTGCVRQCAIAGLRPLSAGGALSASGAGALMSDPLWGKLKGSHDELAWPPLVGGPTAGLLSLARFLEDSQWLSRDEISARQHEQLVKLAEYSMRFSRSFRERLKKAGLEPADLREPANLSRLPLLSRRDLQKGDAYCVQPPKEHLPVNETKTSGSTGEPVTVKRTAITQLFWLAITLREYFWHERAFDLKLSAIRPT